jgi:hypothetical protein
MRRACFWLTILVCPTVALASVSRGEQRTCFQTASHYHDRLDIGSDIAIVYGVNESLPERIKGWRDAGYTIHLMTGIAWGSYEDYFDGRFDGKPHRDEIQELKDGEKMWHGLSTTVGYNVPTDSYASFLKTRMKTAIDLGVEAIHLEEPEFWVRSGWSPAFKQEWQRFYGEPWQPPDSSVDAQYRASKLKYELYFRCLKDVIGFIKEYSGAKGREVACYVPTHSMVNYCSWRIVSPESHLLDLPGLDGYIAQVWTGTARTPNLYAGVGKERTFETAFLEYGQMVSMIQTRRARGTKMWFLADPVEDNPSRTWEDYRRNYECTIVASLFFPGAWGFEVMPWPSRIFRGKYRRAELTTKGAEGIPADYATEILTVINALNDVNQPPVIFDSGTKGIGVLVSDTMMFQRGQPRPTSTDGFFGLTLPLLKRGIPVQLVHLENLLRPDSLAAYRLLILSYDFMKPSKPEYHRVLAGWVKKGNVLMYFGDGSDPYHRVREWWNTLPLSYNSPAEHLFETFGLPRTPQPGRHRLGNGWLVYDGADPAAFARSQPAADEFVSSVKEAFTLLKPAVAPTAAPQWREQNFLHMVRGPYHVIAVLDESVSEKPHSISGSFIDLLDPRLALKTQVELNPGERGFLYDIRFARDGAPEARVLASASRIRDERLSARSLRFNSRGPSATTAATRIFLPREPKEVASSKPSHQLAQKEWDPASQTLLLIYENVPGGVDITVRW